jgi:hypothetical protein
MGFGHHLVHPGDADSPLFVGLFFSVLLSARLEIPLSETSAIADVIGFVRESVTQSLARASVDAPHSIWPGDHVTSSNGDVSDGTCLDI